MSFPENLLFRPPKHPPPRSDPHCRFPYHSAGKPPFPAHLLFLPALLPFQADGFPSGSLQAPVLWYPDTGTSGRTHTHRLFHRAGHLHRLQRLFIFIFHKTCRSQTRNSAWQRRQRIFPLAPARHSLRRSAPHFPALPQKKRSISPHWYFPFLIHHILHNCGSSYSCWSG